MRILRWYRFLVLGVLVIGACSSFSTKHSLRILDLARIKKNIPIALLKFSFQPEVITVAEHVDPEIYSKVNGWNAFLSQDICDELVIYERPCTVVSKVEDVKPGSLLISGNIDKVALAAAQKNEQGIVYYPSTRMLVTVKMTEYSEIKRELQSFTVTANDESSLGELGPERTEGMDIDEPLGNPHLLKELAFEITKQLIEK